MCRYIVWGEQQSAITMSNIPLINQRPIPRSLQARRANQTRESEQSTSKAPKIKRRLERRRKQDRRQKQVNVSFDRRQRGIYRRKSKIKQHLTAESAAISDTVGKNINITA